MVLWRPALQSADRPGHMIRIYRCSGPAAEYIKDFVQARAHSNRALLEDGVAMGVWIDQILVAGVVFSNYNQLPHGSFIELSVASDSARWLTRPVLREIFTYPFEVLNVTRLQTLCHRNNRRARKLTRGLGFKQEGIARRAWDGRSDAVLHSMTVNDWRKMRERFRL